jgi:nucleotide-binding universal stress UspA family protein
MYSKILVAVDGSEHSIRAANHAAKLAALQSKAHVDILYILDYDRARTDLLKEMGREDLHNDRVDLLSSIEAVFEQLQVQHELIIKHGEPGPTIVKFANAKNYQLVVVGSRGLNSFQEMVLGSVSHKVAKRVNAPVLIVK